MRRGRECGGENREMRKGALPREPDGWGLTAEGRVRYRGGRDPPELLDVAAERDCGGKRETDIEGKRKTATARPREREREMCGEK